MNKTTIWKQETKMSQSELEAIEFADNPEPRCACVLLLDVSGSMSGDKINSLNQGLQAFQEDVNNPLHFYPFTL
jgi:hypothetical protein